MTELKICKECKNYHLAGEQPAGSQHRCRRPIIDLVTGKSAPHDAICEQERERTNFTNRCGPEGRFWESRI